ncbi:hypothetical protein [Pseudodonghicola xiamenensis]|uniref:Uncharacterized protein n=1 Tax=Pseudodonghicola xiamenensis TaxID=337702 RepID=A0A8J3H5K6_9RHOB|nr:hypothetical protein [Pseudodonghicola xiamenensis]GHG81458.1 hypothetical protein GCM10010961_05510 [Pseudodonghicola xiamenensis]
MSDLEDFAAKMKTARDELKVQLHLGSKEAEQEWAAFQDRWDRFVAEAQLETSVAEISDATRELGLKLKAAFDRMRRD